MRRILIVDDDPDIRVLLAGMVSRRGCEPLMAEHGLQGLEMCLAFQPHLVLMDVLMPVMDGFEATSRMKSSGGQNPPSPVIFLTGLEDDHELARCLECGGDDFLTKPVNETLFYARMDAWLRRVELDSHVAEEREAVEEVIQRMREAPHFVGEGLRWVMTPLEKAMGDLLLSAVRPDGVRHLMLGDFTGHGLPAAIAGPLVVDIFYSMTAKGFSANAILGEINRKIHEKVPHNMFLAGAFLELDCRRGLMRSWNGSMPDILLFRNGQLIRRMPSRHLALGIRHKDNIATTMEASPVRSKDRIFLCSDGLVESRDSQGNELGGQRLGIWLTRMLREDRPLESILSLLGEESDPFLSRDDITMAEVTCP